MTYRHFELEDGNGKPFRFEGQELGHASSQSDHSPKRRWMEMRVFKTRAGSYVVELVGQTVVEGEVVKSRAHVYTTPRELIDALHTDERDNAGRKTGTRYLTYTARDVLYDVMEKDEAVSTEWENYTRSIA